MPSTATNEQIAKLKQQINEGTEQTKTYLSSIQGKVTDFDKEHKLSDTASDYFKSGLDSANWAVDELKDFSGKIRDEGDNVSEELVNSGKAALSKVQASLETLKTNAVAFDDKVKTQVNQSAKSTDSTMSSFFASAKEQASSGYDQISSALESLASQISASATSAGETISDTAVAAKDKAVDVAEKTKETAGDAGEKAGETGTSLYQKGADLINDGVEYVSNLVSSKPTADKP